MIELILVCLVVLCLPFYIAAHLFCLALVMRALKKALKNTKKLNKDNIKK